MAKIWNDSDEEPTFAVTTIPATEKEAGAMHFHLQQPKASNGSHYGYKDINVRLEMDQVVQFIEGFKSGRELVLRYIEGGWSTSSMTISPAGEVYVIRGEKEFAGKEGKLTYRMSCPKEVMRYLVKSIEMSLPYIILGVGANGV